MLPILHGTSSPFPGCPNIDTLKSKKQSTAEFFEPALGVYLEVTTSPIFNDAGEVVASIHTARNITERKKMEEELRQKVAALEDANLRLKELDKLKDNFLSTVSHELRTPLTSIKSFAEILLNYEEDRATQKEFLGIINEESERLTRLINDFLDLSKIQSGRVQWRTVTLSVARAVETAVTASRTLIEQGGLQLSVDIASGIPDVLCDEDRLVQVVTNLLGNAIKFTPSGGRIGIKAQVVGGDRSTNKPDMVRVSVSDTGIGIAPEHHQTGCLKTSFCRRVINDHRLPPASFDRCS
jgi:signal transduction histidine kinase